VTPLLKSLEEASAARRKRKIVLIMGAESETKSRSSQARKSSTGVRKTNIGE